MFTEKELQILKQEEVTMNETGFVCANQVVENSMGIPKYSSLLGVKYDHGTTTPRFAAVIDLAHYLRVRENAVRVSTHTSIILDAFDSLVKLLQDAQKPLREVVASVNFNSEELPKEMWHMRYDANEVASLGICRQVVRNGEARWGILLLGDTSVIVEYKNGKIESLANPHREKMRKLDDAVLLRMLDLRDAAPKGEKNLASIAQSEEIQRMLKENLARANSEGGYSMFGTDPSAAERAARYEIPCSEVERLLLFTGGFNTQILGMSTKEVMEYAKIPHGLQALRERIINMQHEDENFELQPRFHVHEDFAAVLIERAK